VLQNQNIAQVNLFTVNNIVHDIHYKYGFTEAAGNFQANDYGR
jgi:extracellular elastinolytic metalloproteinase